MSVGTEAAPQNYTDFVRQSLQQFNEYPEWFEEETPMYSSLKKNVGEVPFTFKGYQMPYISRRPGGHTSYTPQASSFNQVVPGQSQSMFVYPTRYALPMVFEDALLHMIGKGGPAGDMALLSYNQLLDSYMRAAAKRLEIFMAGNGSGALAYSASSLASTGSGQTLTCTTTAAATAGQTKGALYLEEGHTYQSINVSTEAVRGSFTVETPGTSSCVVNVTSGSIVSGDRVVDVGGNQRAPRGMAHLISGADRLLQALNTANFRDLNAPEIDLVGDICTPVTFDQVKTMLQYRNNKETAENQLMCWTTPGQYSNLKQQGWNLTIQSTTVTTGIAKKYSDGDTMFVLAADMDEDRFYLFRTAALRMFEEQKLGPINLDGLELRMLMGDNGTGSANWQRAIGCVFNPGVNDVKATALIKRAAISTSQLSSY